MKKKNTWMTIALGGLVTVTVAAAAIVWSGNRTKEKPDTGLESTGGIDPADDFIPQVYHEETQAPDDGENNATRQEETYGRWEAEKESVALENPETVQVMENKPEPSEPENVAEAAGSQVYSLNFSPEDTIGWPVSGNVIQYYSMDTTVYFPTLKQYRCSPAIEIQSEAGTQVNAPANAKITETGEDARIGKYVRMDLGNDYQIVLGQLADICVREGDYVARGTRLGTVAAPTRYYVVEGDNVYVQMLQNGETVDPLDYLE